MRPPTTAVWKTYAREPLVLAGLLAAVDLVLTGLAFGRGDSQFLIRLNNLAVPPLAVCVTVMAGRLWQQAQRGSSSRRVWAGLALGWACWALAESWWSAAYLTGQELPYPSGADYFWLAGYGLLLAAFWLRLEALPVSLTQRQRGVLWALSLLVVGFTTYAVLVPIGAAYDSGQMMESVLNLLYPLADLALLVMVARIFFAYQQGAYGRAWVWISLGFMLIAFSDLVFAYANARDLYYPDQQANALSAFLVDFPYIGGYLLSLSGVWVLGQTQQTHRPFQADAFQFDLVPNAHVLVSTLADDTVIDLSPNGLRALALDGAWKGRPLWELGSLAEGLARALLAEVKAQTVLRERVIEVFTPAGRQSAFCSGIAVVETPGEYSGAVFLLCLLTPAPALDEALTDYQRGMVRSLLAQTGAQARETEQVQRLCAQYYSVYLRALFNQVLAEGGGLLADEFLTALRAAGRRRGWNLPPHPTTLLDVAALPPAERQAAWPFLVAAAQAIIAQMDDRETVERVVREVETRIPAAVHQNLRQFGAAQPEPSASAA